MPSLERAEVAIVGGGIAGLSAAYALWNRGVDFRVLEAGSRFGGVIRTESLDGFLLEAGPDSLLAQKPEALTLCRELGLADRLIPTNPKQRAVYVLHRGRLHPLPEGMMLAVPTRLGSFLGSGLFSWPGKLRMGLDLLLPARRQSGDESIASFLRRRFGQQCVERLGEPLLAGIHAGDPERLSILATFPRFAELEKRHRSLIRGMWAAPRPAPRPGAPATAFYSLQGGLEELVAAIEGRLSAECLWRRAAVASLARADKGFRLDLTDGRTVAARAVVMAVPAPKSAPLLRPLLPEVAEALAGIPFATTATVLLGLRRADVRNPLAGYGLVVPAGEGLRTSAASFFSTKFPGRAPAGHVLLRGFLGGVRDPSILELDDAEIAATFRREMEPVLGLSGEPVLTRVYRWPQGTPQMEVGHGERIAEVERRLAELPGLFLTGAGIRGTGIPDGIADGMAAARQAVAFLAGALD